MFLKRYDSKRVREWGSVNDMIPWELRRKRKGIEGVRRTAWRASMVRRARKNRADLQNHYSILVQYVNDYL
jgi:hypothetical protein